MPTPSIGKGVAFKIIPFRVASLKSVRLKKQSKNLTEVRFAPEKSTLDKKQDSKKTESKFALVKLERFKSPRNTTVYSRRGRLC